MFGTGYSVPSAARGHCCLSLVPLGMTSFMSGLIPASLSRLVLLAVIAEASVMASEWCELAVYPAVLDFGNVAVASASKLTLKATSVGGSGCSVGPLSITGSSDFVVTPSAPKRPVSLPSGESMTISISFTPKRLGTAEGVLNIATDDPNQPVTVIGLAGSGVRAAM